MRIAKGILLLICLLLGFGLASAQVLIENFNYGATDNADIRSVAVVGADTVWARHSGVQGPAYKAAGLTYAGYPLSGIGGSMWFTNGGSGVNDGDVHRKLSDSTTTDRDIFVAFLARIDSAKAIADYFFHLNPYTISTTFRARTFVRSSGTGYSLGLAKSATTMTDSSTVILEYGRTYLFVIKWAFNTVVLDTINLYVYASGVPATLPGSPLVSIGPVTTGSDPANIGSVAIRQGTNTPTGVIDGIRVATTYGGLLTNVRSDELLPGSFALSQNYPNPFNPSTTIRFEIAKATNVSLRVFDMLGREVDVLVDGLKEPGAHSLTWETANRPTGVYYYQLRAGNAIETKQMLLVR